MQRLVNLFAFGVLDAFLKLREVIADQVFIDLCQFLEQRVRICPLLLRRNACLPCPGVADDRADVDVHVDRALKLAPG